MNATLKTETFTNIVEVMNEVSVELSDLDPSLSLNGEIFIDLNAKRVWFRVWNEEANTNHWVAQVPERSALGESLVAVDDTTEALMFR
ncbi:hypothetical protein KDJ07_gp51 [Arthrobacter phage Urla]|uniref:Uncharacterized protein n=1 Tax=Arthrobacter phage Urla TaxID=2047867 RepID=A0A2H4P960_9CAUD|nr:hypothetical protein KDJ07_gp51 [Arthrobacter phage Urla]ATW58765.1 hypothetical protein PHIRE_URLA_51 [Arthrobacter phage Urla]